MDDLGRAVFGDVLRGDNDFGVVRVGHQIHGAAHALEDLARDHVIGKIASRADLERSENGHVDVTTADHGEGLGAVEGRSARNEGDCFLSGVDNVPMY